MPLGGGQAGAARPGMSSLLGNQPAFKELWLNEMFSCAKSLLGNVTGQLWGGWAWPGRSAQRCQEGCWGEAWKGQRSPLLPLLLEPSRACLPAPYLPSQLTCRVLPRETSFVRSHLRAFARGLPLAFGPLSLTSHASLEVISSRKTSSGPSCLPWHRPPALCGHSVLVCSLSQGGSMLGEGSWFPPCCVGLQAHTWCAVCDCG